MHFIQIRSAPGRNSAPAGINLIPYAASVVVNGKVQISEIIENMLVFLPFGLCISAFYPDSEIQNRILLASGLSLFLR